MIRKIPPPSPSKAFVSTVEMDFETIFNNLKGSRDRVKPSPVTSRQSFVDIDGGILYSPQPQRLIDLQNCDIRMETLGSQSHGTTRCADEGVASATPAGSLREKRCRTHGLWDSNSEGFGCHLGLVKAVKLT